MLNVPSLPFDKRGRAMAHIGEAVLRYPLSGSYEPVFMRVITQNASASFSSVPALTSSVLVASSSINRQNLTFFNDSPRPCYLRFGGAPANSSLYSNMIAASSYFDMEGAFTGEVYAAWDTATGSLKVTEFFS